MKNYVLNIEGQAFASMREDFNKVIKRTVNNMEEKASNNAEITIKLKIELVPDYLPPQQSDQEGRAILKPKFEHKVSSVMNTKFEEAGSLKGDYELVWDEELQDYVARPIGFEQTSIFDDKTNCYYGEAEEIVDEPHMLLEEPPMLLEEATQEETDDEVIEEDFVDIDAMVENLKDMYGDGETSEVEEE